MRNVEADERGEGGVLLVPIEGGGILCVAAVPVPCFSVSLRAADGCRSVACCHFRRIYRLMMIS